MDQRLSRRAGRTLRKTALVVLMLFAAVVAPIALPIRMVVDLVRRDTRRTEQIVRQQEPGVWRLRAADELASTA